MEARTFNIRDTAGYLVFATDDPEAFVAEAERRDAEGDKSLFDGPDPKQVRKELQTAAKARQQADKQQVEIEQRYEARVAELAADPDALARAIVNLEGALVPAAGTEG